MASITIPPRPQDPEAVDQLVGALTRGAIKPKSKTEFTCKRTNFTIDGTDLQVSSWKIPDFDYKKRLDLPTNARGLFTHKNAASGNHEIAVRGYDKFFNIDEVHQTKWNWIHENTKAPYELTLKENGCIIFISGLPEGELLVCSKHSTGERDDVELSHAAAGENWVNRQLEAVGKTRKDFSEYLRSSNITAVAELCDDTFEEHILDYEGDRAGLYLHGINYNLPDFATLDMPAVYSFGDMWGFKRIDYVVKQDVLSLKQFLEKAAETGSWGGRSTEGFVIRCKARYGPKDTNWHDWFFKYKFEEPYLMFRQWRECTKKMIHNKGKPILYKKHRKITKEYLDFAARFFTQNPAAKKEYMLNHGIISLRNAFLASRGLNTDDVRRVQESEESEENAAKNFVIVPIATIGVGKTTISLGLTKLFGWGHQQNDNVTAKKGKAGIFASSCCMELANSPCVIADRNNHQKREREQLMKDISATVPDAKYIAMHFVHDRKLASDIKKTTRDRVFARGDNHQTIAAGSKSRVEIEGIMDGFIQRFQPLDMDHAPDSDFDSTIDLDPTAGSRKNLEQVVRELHQLYPALVPVIPEAKEFDEAIKFALGYNPAIKHEIKSGSRKGATPNVQKKEVEYFSIALPTATILDVLKRTFTADPSKAAFFQKLQQTGRIQSSFHVTLVHRADSRRRADIWDRYNNLHIEKGIQPLLGTLEVKLKEIVWDGRVMAFVVELPAETECANEVPHITIGTVNMNVKPRESNGMLTGKRKEGKCDSVEVGDVKVDGEVKAVLGR